MTAMVAELCQLFKQYFRYKYGTASQVAVVEMCHIFTEGENLRIWHSLTGKQKFYQKNAAPA